MATAYLTLGEIARRHGYKTWQLRRLYERGLLPPAKRLGLYRVVHVDDVIRVLHAARAAGYVPTAEAAAVLK